MQRLVLKFRRENILPGLLVAAILVAALPALVQLVWHARLFAGRATFPLDLEWMEGGVLLLGESLTGPLVLASFTILGGIALVIVQKRLG